MWPVKISSGARELLYVASGAPLGLIWCLVMLGGLTMGLGLSFVLFGIPLLAALGITRWGANTERGVRATLAGGGTLTLTASCPGRLHCDVNYTLSVPREAAIEVSAGFGDITASGLKSASSIRLGTTAGDIRATGLNAPDVRLSTGLGGLTASLARPSRRLEASTGAGALELTVPDTTYALRASSNLGHVSDRSVPVDPGAPHSIDAHSSLGDVTIAVAQ
jgi:hypothetical protein